MTTGWADKILGALASSQNLQQDRIDVPVDIDRLVGALEELNEPEWYDLLRDVVIGGDRHPYVIQIFRLDSSFDAISQFPQLVRRVGESSARRFGLAAETLVHFFLNLKDTDDLQHLANLLKLVGNVCYGPQTRTIQSVILNQALPPDIRTLAAGVLVDFRPPAPWNFWESVDLNQNPFLLGPFLAACAETDPRVALQLLEDAAITDENLTLSESSLRRCVNEFITQFHRNEFKDFYMSLSPLGQTRVRKILALDEFAPIQDFISLPAPSAIKSFDKIFRSHAESVLMRLNGGLQSAALLGSELVTSGHMTPDSISFKDEYRQIADQVFRIVYERDREKAGLAIGQIVRGAAVTTRELVSDKLLKQIDDRSPRELLLQMVGEVYPLKNLVDELCESAHDCEFRSIDFDCSEYSEDQSKRCFLDTLIETPDLRLNFYSGRWSPSGKTPAPQDVKIASKVLTSDTALSELKHSYLYEFKGYHVFVDPDWLFSLRRTATGLPSRVKDYLASLVSADFNIKSTDEEYPDDALSIRAWLSLYGGAEFHGGKELTMAVPVIQEAASKIRMPLETRYRIARDSDAVFEGLITGKLPAVLLGAIHGDLIKTWWNRNLLSFPLSRLELFGPDDFAVAMKGRHFFNYLRCGLDSFQSDENKNRYRACWVKLLRCIGGILSELSETVLIPKANDLTLDGQARDFILNFLFTHLGASHKERISRSTRPGMNWAFVADPVSLRRLYMYDDFTTELTRAA